MSVVGTSYRGVRDGSLPASLRKIAEDELGETSDKRREAVEKLRRLLEDEPELHSRLDEEFLLGFIRVRKYNIEAALKTVKKYYRTRSANGVFHGKCVPSGVSPAARKLAIVLHQQNVSQQVLLWRSGEWDPSTVSYKDAQDATLLCLDRIAMDPSSQTAGICFLLDYKGFSMANLFACNIMAMRRCLDYFQDGFPVRFKGFHVVNESLAFDLMYALLRPVVKKKMMERIHLHGTNFESLAKHIPPSILPEEYGGQAPPLDFDTFWKSMDDDEATFAEHARFGYLEDDATPIVTAL